MRIMNQHRNRSVNFDNVEIRVDDTRVFAESDRSIILGEYDTEERALEVFQEIHKFFARDRVMDFSFGKECIGANSVYYMPIS